MRKNEKPTPNKSAREGAGFLPELVASVKAKLTAYPDTFDTQDLAGKTCSKAELSAQEKTLGIQLPPLLRTVYLEVGTPFGFYWSVKSGGKLDADDSPQGQLELIALQNLRFQDGQLLRFTNDGYGNGYCLDYSKRRKPGIVFWDHDGAKTFPRKEKNLEAFFKSWAAILFVNAEVEQLDIEPVLELVSPAKRTKKAPPRKPLPAGFTQLPFPVENGISGTVCETDRLFVSTFKGEVFEYDLGRCEQVACYKGYPSLRGLVRLPDRRFAASSDAFGVFTFTTQSSERTPLSEFPAVQLRLLEDRLLSVGEKYALMLDFTGKKLLKFTVPRNVQHVVTFEKRVVLSAVEELVCFDLETGTRLWSDNNDIKLMPAALYAHGDNASLVFVGGGLLSWNEKGERSGKIPKKPKVHVSVAWTASHILAGWLGTFEILDLSGRSLKQIAISENQWVRVHPHPGGEFAIVRSDDELYWVNLREASH